MQYPFIQTLNRAEATYRFSMLPEHMQEFFRLLWAQGVIVEIFGKVSHQWQPMSQYNASWNSSDCYRLKGDNHYAVLKKGRTQLEQEVGVFITDPVQLPVNSICYMSDSYALSATITPYQG